MDPIAWHTLVFGLPIALAMVLGVGALGGLGEAELEVDVDVDVDADVDADAESETDGEPGFSILQLLGVGRAPFGVLLSVALLGFGATGLALSAVTSPFRFR